MKEAVADLSIAILISLVGVGGFTFAVYTMSQKYAEKHPEIIRQAQEQTEQYNKAVDAHNARLKEGYKD